MDGAAICIIAYAALGQVQRVRRCLGDTGRFADMIRTPKVLAQHGCGFSLRVPETELAAVRAASEATGIDIRGIFREEPGGYEALP